jgi:hypothetical protein
MGPRPANSRACLKSRRPTDGSMACSRQYNNEISALHADGYGSCLALPGFGGRADKAPESEPTLAASGNSLRPFRGLSPSRIEQLTAIPMRTAWSAHSPERGPLCRRPSGWALGRPRRTRSHVRSRGPVVSPYSAKTNGPTAQTLGPHPTAVDQRSYTGPSGHDHRRPTCSWP